MKKLLSTAAAILCIGAATMAQVPNNVPTNGLVGWWGFNGNANDASGNGHNGTINGSTWQNDRKSNPNNALSFNGTTNYVSLNNTIGNLGTSSFSITGWINLTAFPNQPYSAAIFSKRNSPGAQESFITLGVTGSGSLGAEVCTNQYQNIQDSSALILNRWYFVCLTKSNDSLLLYVNGEKVKAEKYTLTGSITNTAMASIGASNINGNWAGFVNAILDDIGIWNRVLTQQEISALYKGCFDTITNDTTIFYVSSANFQSVSPRAFLSSTDSLKTTLGCDSIIYHYQKFVFEPNHYTDTNTVIVQDTVTVDVHIAVTDTLIINRNLIGLNPVTYENTIKIYPNPAKDNLSIDFGSNFSAMNGFSLKITNTLGQMVYTTDINAQQKIVDISQWANGIYTVNILNAQSNTVETRKLVLQ